MCRLLLFDASEDGRLQEPFASTPLVFLPLQFVEDDHIVFKSFVGDSWKGAFAFRTFVWKMVNNLSERKQTPWKIANCSWWQLTSWINCWAVQPYVSSLVPFFVMFLWLKFVLHCECGCRELVSLCKRKTLEKRECLGQICACIVVGDWESKDPHAAASRSSCNRLVRLSPRTERTKTLSTSVPRRTCRHWDCSCHMQAASQWFPFHGLQKIFSTIATVLKRLLVFWLLIVQLSFKKNGQCFGQIWRGLPEIAGMCRKLWFPAVQAITQLREFLLGNFVLDECYKRCYFAILFLDLSTCQVVAKTDNSWSWSTSWDNGWSSDLTYFGQNAKVHMKTRPHNSLFSNLRRMRVNWKKIWHWRLSNCCNILLKMDHLKILCKCSVCRRDVPEMRT